jgi:hypothetical protein
MPYVGDYQFRFVAGMNRSFYNSYKTFLAKYRILHMDGILFNVIDVLLGGEYWTLVDVSTPQHTKICYEETVPQRYDFCQKAAKHGNLQVLEYLHTELGCPWDVRTCAAAGRFGHVHVLEYARTNGCDWNDSTLINAAQNGHLSILEWALQNGYSHESISIYVSSNAAEQGHLHILQWLHENRCPFHEDVKEYAADKGHKKIVQWLCARGY